MKSIFRRRSAKVMAAVAGLATGAIVAFTLLGSGASAAGTFGPSRPTKVWSPTTSGFNYVTFNSFTNVGNGIGNEEDFYRGVDVGRDSTWTNPVQNVTQDSEVEAQIYIHNNADSSLNASGVGVAHNVTVRVSLPTGTAQTQDTTAYISASNANPGTVYDTMQITGANQGYFALAEEAGTAQLHEQNGSVTTLTAAQEAELFSPTGLNLGDQDGCFSYVQEITFKMRVNMPEYKLTKQVRFNGQTANDWVSSLNAKNGDTLQWSLDFTNNGSTQLNDVTLLDQVPAGLDVVPGSVVLYNGNYPNGYTFPNSAIQDNGRQINLNIGDYLPLGTVDQSNGQVSAQVIYATKVDESATQECSAETFTNKAYATPQGFGAIYDTASANVAASKTCQQTPPPTTTTKTPTTPTTLVNTGPGDVIGLFGLTTVAGAVAHRLFVRRFSRS